MPTALHITVKMANEFPVSYLTAFFLATRYQLCRGQLVNILNIQEAQNI